MPGCCCQLWKSKTYCSKLFLQSCDAMTCANFISSGYKHVCLCHNCHGLINAILKNKEPILRTNEQSSKEYTYNIMSASTSCQSSNCLFLWKFVCFIVFALNYLVPIGKTTFHNAKKHVCIKFVIVHVVFRKMYPDRKMFT